MARHKVDRQFAIFFIPHTRAVRRKPYNGPKHSASRFRLSGAVAELRPLSGVVREKHFGLALGHAETLVQALTGSAKNEILVLKPSMQ